MLNDLKIKIQYFALHLKRYTSQYDVDNNNTGGRYLSGCIWRVFAGQWVQFVVGEMAFNLNSVEQMQICRALCSTTSQYVAGIGSSDDYAAMLADPVSYCSRLLLLLLLLTDTSSSPPWLVPAPTSDFADRLFLMWPPLLLLLHARRPASWLVGCGAKQLALAVSMVLPVSIADRFVLWPSLPQRCAYTRLIHWWTTDPQGYTNSPQIWLCCVTNCMNYCRPMTAHQNINITRLQFVTH